MRVRRPARNTRPPQYLQDYITDVSTLFNDTDQEFERHISEDPDTEDVPQQAYIVFEPQASNKEPNKIEDIPKRTDIAPKEVVKAFPKKVQHVTRSRSKAAGDSE